MVLERLGLTGDAAVAAVALVCVEFLVAVTYLLVVPAASFAPRYLLLVAVPFVWLDAALYGVWAARPSAANARRRVVALALAVGYLVVLAYVGGVLVPGIGERALGWRLTLALPPGWSPALLYSGEVVGLNLIPYKVVGYVVLAYLVYATVLDASGGALAGVLGLFSCVSCSLPLIAAVVSSLLGGAGALAAVASAQSYALSTVAFVVTVALLTWRPTAADFSRMRAKLRA